MPKMSPTKQLNRFRRSSVSESIPFQGVMQNIVIGRVQSINGETNRITIRLDSVGGNLPGVRYANGLDPKIGNLCVAVSVTPKDKSSFLIIAFFS